MRLSRVFGTAGSVTFESNGVFLFQRARRTRMRFPGFRDIRHEPLAAVDFQPDRLPFPWLYAWGMNLSVRRTDFDAVGDDEQRLLEARVEAGEIGEVRAVLAIRVDQEPIHSGALHSLAEPVQSGRVGRRRDLGHRVGHAEGRQLHLRQAWGRRIAHSSSSEVQGGEPP